MHGCQHVLLALRGIGGQQVIQRRREFGVADFRDRFRIAARLSGPPSVKQAEPELQAENIPYRFIHALDIDLMLSDQ